MQASWLIRLHEAQENYKNACRQSKGSAPSSKMAAKGGDAAAQQQQRTDDTGSVLASPVDTSFKTPLDLRGPSLLRPAPSSRMGRVRGAFPFRREEEDGAEEEEQEVEEGAEREHPRRSKPKNRSSSSDAMTEIGADVHQPRSSMSSSVSRRISDPLRRHLTPGFDGDDGSPGGPGSDRSSSVSVFGGPTTHVVLVTVHAAEGSAMPSTSTLHRIGVQSEVEEDVGVSRRGFYRSSPDRAGGGARGVALQKTVKHHSSLKVRRKGAMKAIQEKSLSFDAIQI